MPGAEHGDAWCSESLEGVDVNDLLMEACLAFQTRLRVIATEGNGCLDRAAQVKHASASLAATPDDRSGASSSTDSVSRSSVRDYAHPCAPAS